MPAMNAVIVLANVGNYKPCAWSFSPFVRVAVCTALTLYIAPMRITWLPVAPQSIGFIWLNVEHCTYFAYYARNQCTALIYTTIYCVAFISIDCLCSQSVTIFGWVAHTHTRLIVYLLPQFVELDLAFALLHCRPPTPIRETFNYILL